MKIFIVATSLIFWTSLHLFFFSLPPADTKSLPNQEEKKLYQMSAAEIDELMIEVSGAYPSLAQKISAYSRRALGTPYVAGCLGEGMDGIYDKDPLIDFSRVDCMTFCEQILALAISENYHDAFHNLQKIRYHHGIISFVTRNHFVMADWLPHNQWLLKDITGEIGGIRCRKMTKTINRRAFAEAQGLAHTKDIAPSQHLTIDYLPKDYLSAVSNRMQGGEVMVLITTRKSIFASHLGLIIKADNGALFFRHASLTHKKVIDESYDLYCKTIQGETHIAGVVFIKLRKNYTIPGH